MNKKRIKSIIFQILLIIGFFVIISLNFGGIFNKDKNISYNEFLTMVDDGKVDSVKISDNELSIKLIDDKTTYLTGYVQYDKLVDLLYDAGINFEKIEKPSFSITDLLISFIFNFGPLILMVIFFLRIFSAQSGGNGILSVGKSKATLNINKDTGINFQDVAGQDEAKEQLTEIIDYLHNPKKYQQIGAKIPKGALLVGPPGTGKTLLAKAVAGEAKVPFFSVTGSDFIEMYVGVGASRIRDLFEQAKQNAPCIIFIDEVDSIAKSRDGATKGGSNDEREQTLNQLLSEMDGFDSSKGIIILAATNRPEILDKAFLRAGRFDRKVIVERPDFKGRVATLKVHSKNVKLDSTVDFDSIAYATTGSVGADLENIVNEAALRAVKFNRIAVSQEDFMDAVETVFAGKEKKDRIMSDKEKTIVAYHEVGHAITAAIQKNTSPVQKITIVPRTKGSLGYTLQIPDEEKFLYSKDEMIAEIKTLLGGRCAEEVIFNTITTGASNDIERATQMAREMITLYGMSDRFDMVGLELIQNKYLDGTPVRNCSESTSTIIDEEILDIIKKCHKETKLIIANNKNLMEQVATYLLEKESITGEEFMLIFRKYYPEGKEIIVKEVSEETFDKKDSVKNIPDTIKNEQKSFIENNIIKTEKTLVEENKKISTEIPKENISVIEEPKKEEDLFPKIKIDDSKPEEKTSASILLPQKEERPSASVLGPKKKKPKNKNKATPSDIKNLLNSVENKKEDINQRDSSQSKKKLYEEAIEDKEPKVEAAGKAGNTNSNDYKKPVDDIEDITEEMF